MKVTFIGHASVLIETAGISVLSDPWWRGPCFGAQWWNRPEPDLSAIPEALDYVYISHGHEDHLHPGTLKTLSRETTILVSSRLSLSGVLTDLGFKVIEVEPDEPTKLSEEVSVYIWPTHGDDTLFVLRDHSEILINLNDALHSAPRNVQEEHIQKLISLFPDPDYVFCGYGIASHFPNCYFIPGKNDERTAAQRQAYFNTQWAYIMHALHPKFGFPFAANVVFFEKDLVSLNEAVHNSERPTDCYSKMYGAGVGQLIDISPGFWIDSGVIGSDRRFQPVSISEMLNTNEEAYSRANKYAVPSDSEFAELVDLLRTNIELCKNYLLEHSGNYRFGILLRGSDTGIAIEKQSSRIHVEPTKRAEIESPAFDVTFETRAVYLRRSLQEDYANEVLFVGSGGVFRYRSRQDADRNLHRELVVILQKHDRCPASRYGDNPRWLYHVKRQAKRILGKETGDLYDLSRWVIYD